jgi:uncharacterized protein
VIALLGDTHLPRGGRSLSTRCVGLLAAADLIVHTGDFTTLETLRSLERLAPVAAVHGNVDDAELRALLPGTRVVEHAGRRIGLVHDAGPVSGRHERLVERFPGCDLIAYGHTHFPEVAKHGDVWIVSPGSPTERRRAPARAMAVVEDGAPRIVTVS